MTLLAEFGAIPAIKTFNISIAKSIALLNKSDKEKL